MLRVVFNSYCKRNGIFIEEVQIVERNVFVDKNVVEINSVFVY